MSKKIKIAAPSRDFTPEEILQLCKDMIAWFHSKDDHILVEDFLYLNKKMIKTDVQFLLATSEDFKIAYENANEIELTKLKVYGAGDRLNSSIVKTILSNKYDWL